MHVAGADGTNEYSALVIAEGEGNEERSSRLVLSNRDEPLLGSGMLHVGRHLWSCHKCRLNIRQRHAVFPALANIAMVSIETRNPFGSSAGIYICIDKCQYQDNSTRAGRVGRYYSAYTPLTIYSY